MEQSFPGGTETILVVEDEPAVRDYVSLQLEALGYTVLTASNGAEALEVLHRGRVDLLFTDMVMPGEMDGRQLADAAHELHPELKILFTSGYTEHAVIHNGRLERGVNLLSKPYRREQLAEKIRNILDKDGTPSAH
jgi:CheY-like chemotaxis protein